MSYLDLLKDDNMEMILKYATDDLEANILKLRKKINNLKVRLRPLKIKYYDDTNCPCIRYDKVSYSMDNYLFNNFYDEDFADKTGVNKPGIVIMKQFDEYFCEGVGMTFRSNMLKSPTYLDILIEANKSIIITNNFYHMYLVGIKRINNKKLIEHFNIRPNIHIIYYELIMEG
jgi:hypothetical protein